MDIEVYLATEDRVGVSYVLADGTSVDVEYRVQVLCTVSPEAWGVEIDCEVEDFNAISVEVTTSQGEPREVDEALALAYADDLFEYAMGEVDEALRDAVPVSRAAYAASSRALTASYFW